MRTYRGVRFGRPAFIGKARVVSVTCLWPWLAISFSPQFSLYILHFHWFKQLGSGHKFSQLLPQGLILSASLPQDPLLCCLKYLTPEIGVYLWRSGIVVWRRRGIIMIAVRRSVIVVWRRRDILWRREVVERRWRGIIVWKGGIIVWRREQKLNCWSWQFHNWNFNDFNRPYTWYKMSIFSSTFIQMLWTCWMHCDWFILTAGKQLYPGTAGVLLVCKKNLIFLSKVTYCYW